MTYFEAATSARAALIDAGLRPETARLDAELLARHTAGWDLATWLVRRGDRADEAFERQYEQVIERRLKREPVAFIRGIQEFWNRDFVVTPDVLIPRPETELLIEHANQFLATNRSAQVVDVGTGSGCIAITLALENPSLNLYATDISEAALSVARHNAERLGVADRVRFLNAAYLDGCPRPVDLIVANPPYVAEADKAGLSPEVRDHEPAVALFGGEDGWRDIRQLLLGAAEALHSGGRLMMEMGYGQSEKLDEEVRAAGLALERVLEDLQGIPRVAVVRSNER